MYHVTGATTVAEFIAYRPTLLSCSLFSSRLLAFSPFRFLTIA
jgi:hypothetical protein